jgi:hypothetical protein
VEAVLARWGQALDHDVLYLAGYLPTGATSLSIPEQFTLL